MTAATIDVGAIGSPAPERAGAERLRKPVLRQGRWDSVPTPSGRLSRPLDVAREGRSRFGPDRTVIAMAELVASFGAVGPVPVLLSSDPSNHHRAAPADHVGRVESVEIDGNLLIATLSLPDPSHRARLLTGTLDVSAGIEFEVSGYGAVLSHLAVTPTPFLDGLGEFALAASERRARGEMACFADVPAASLHSREPETPEEALAAAQRERMRAGARPARRSYAGRPLDQRVAEMKAALGK